MFHLALSFLAFGCWLHLDAKLNPVFLRTRTTITVFIFLILFENDKEI
jgi:hypothetical protein